MFSEYADVKSCVAEFRQHCELVDIAVFRGRDHAYDWMCDEAFEGELSDR